jgi:HEAT repeat protein
VLRVGIFRGLAEMGPDAKAAVPALLAILREPREGDLRSEAAKALGEIGAGDKTVLAALTEALKDSGTAPGAFRGLVLLGEPPVPILLDVFRKKDDPLRANSVAAAEALGEIGAPAVPALIEALQEKDLGLRIVVCNALGRLGPQAKAAVPALTELFKKGDLPSGITLNRIDPEAAKKAGFR